MYYETLLIYHFSISYTFNTPQAHIVLELSAFVNEYKTQVCPTRHNNLFHKDFGLIWSNVLEGEPNQLVLDSFINWASKLMLLNMN